MKKMDTFAENGTEQSNVPIQNNPQVIVYVACSDSMLLQEYIQRIHDFLDSVGAECIYLMEDFEGVHNKIRIACNDAIKESVPIVSYSLSTFHTNEDIAYDLISELFGYGIDVFFVDYDNYDFGRVLDV